MPSSDASLSLVRLLEPEVLANPYPLYHKLRSEDPVHWDRFLQTWVVTRYDDVVTVLSAFSADRTPTPEQLSSMGLSELNPIAKVMVKQMLFMDGPAHARLRGLASTAFTPQRVAALRSHIQEIAENLVDRGQDRGQMDIIADFAAPLPAIVTAEMLGVPTEDHVNLKKWSADFAEMLGNFQHNPDRVSRVLASTNNLVNYFNEAIRRMRTHPKEGLIHSLMTAELDGDRLSEEEIVANCIVTMVGGQETTTNLIGSGLLTLMQNREQFQRLLENRDLLPSAIEELLRYESPSQHTGRIAREDVDLGGKKIRKGQAVMAIMAAANRDPERFPDPDRLILDRKDNKHLAFGWSSHFCFGAPLARMEAQICFEILLRRLKNLELTPGSLTWRENSGLRGLTALPVTFSKN